MTNCHQCLMYSTPVPSGLLAAPPMTQVNLTLPATPAQIAAAFAAKAAFFDYEGIVADAGPLTTATADQLRDTFAAAKTHANSLGWYIPVLGHDWNPLWQPVYPPMLAAAHDLYRMGVCDALDWVGIGAYADAAGTDPENWHNKIIGQLAVAKSLHKPAYVFLSLRYQGQGSAVDGPLFVKMCVHVRGLLDAKLADGAVLWDAGPTPNAGFTPWTGDVESNITWGWKKFIES